MFSFIKKWIIKKYHINKPIEFENRIYTIRNVFKDYILVDTPYFTKQIENKDINKIKFININKNLKIGDVIKYYDQQFDKNKTGTVVSIEQDGTIKLEDGTYSHANYVNILKKGMRRYNKGSRFKHNGKWFSIEDCFLTENGLCYSCIGEDLLGYMFLEKDLISFNKEF